MTYEGKCEQCGAATYAGGEDAWRVCTGCGNIWRLDGPLVSRGRETGTAGIPRTPEVRDSLIRQGSARS